MKATVTMARTEQIDGFAITLFDESPEELATLDNAMIVCRSSDWDGVTGALSAGQTVLDPLLGISIQRLGSRLALPYGAGMHLQLQPPPAATGDFWYIDRLEGWPTLTGRGAKVAVLDIGCGFRHCYLPALIQGINYASTVAQIPDCATPSDHGTRCAGVIGARGHPDQRIGVAPNAELAFGQLGWTSPGSIDLLLMLSWAISVWGAQVVSHSRAHAVDTVKSWDWAVMSHVARRAKCYGNTLIFSSAGNEGDALRFPAAAEHVVAVGAYGSGAVLMHQSGKNELAARIYALLGPGLRLQTTEIGGNCDLTEFSDTSAACAFVAGCAALYYEWFVLRGQAFTAEEVFRKMAADAELISDGSALSWRGVRFPK